MAFFGATVFFAAVGPCRVMSLEKKKFQAKKTSKISKKSSPRASDTGKGSYKHNAPDLWDRGSTYIHTYIPREQRGSRGGSTRCSGLK